MFKKSTICPSCKTIGKLHKSHSRGIIERIINHTYIWGLFRCHNCGWRGVLLRKNTLKISFSGLLKTILTLAIVYYIVVYFIKNYTN